MRGIDITRPNSARSYDCLPGGKGNSAAGRVAAKRLIATIPDDAGMARTIGHSPAGWCSSS
jgi:hypothetical protein